MLLETHDLCNAQSGLHAIKETLESSFSAVSTPIFATEEAIQMRVKMCYVLLEKGIM